MKGSFYRGMRLGAVDGFVLDAPETEANRRRLGGPKDGGGQVAGFPPVRGMTLTGTGTHAQIVASGDGGFGGASEVAIKVPRPAAGMPRVVRSGGPRESR